MYTMSAAFTMSGSFEIVGPSSSFGRFVSKSAPGAGWMRNLTNQRRQHERGSYVKWSVVDVRWSMGDGARSWTLGHRDRE